ncbi:MAG: 3-methyl-2-oxobutanoate hydroxymethyltransferase [Verrucomicrobiota bacterium]|nr:3-methyl-2-oxobutanoate hydroxymethyltransferase [Verrucomicrobiota bacterium]
MLINQNSKKQTVAKEVSSSPQKVQFEGTPSSSQSREKGSSPKSNRSKNPRKNKPFEKSRPKHSPQEHEPRTRTTLELLKLKGKRTIVGLTAYDALLGRLVSDAGVDFILVGDSVGTTMLGHSTTIPVTIQDMIHHTASVRRANPDCLLVADLPFGEASLSFDRLLESARSLMQKGGADAVKIEGGRDVADDIEKLVLTGIPVLGHIGLLPQTVKAIGGYRKFGSKQEEAESLYTDAIALEEAGCFGLVAEMVEASVASELARQILPPLIGIGSGDGCDGQILVTPDLLGLSNGSIPSFVKPKLNLNQEISQALTEYVIDVKKRKKSPSS